MNVVATGHPDIKILEPKVFEDARGFVMESYNERVFGQCIDNAPRFVQDNHSSSARDVLRGLHYQVGQPQAKLVRVMVGEIFDVAVDLRRSRPTYGEWVGVNLSAENRRQMWIPAGFAHGFLVLSARAECAYKLSAPHRPELERCLLWCDPDVGVEWPIRAAPLLSQRDRVGVALEDAESFA